MGRGGGRIASAGEWGGWKSRNQEQTGINMSMRLSDRRAAGVILACSLLICGTAILMRSNAPFAQEKTTSVKKSRSSGGGIADAYRLNTLGVAYMNQQRPADAQKYFDQALEANPKFAVPRLNLGVSLLAQQKLNPPRPAP